MKQLDLVLPNETHFKNYIRDLTSVSRKLDFIASQTNTTWDITPPKADYACYSLFITDKETNEDKFCTCCEDIIELENEVEMLLIGVKLAKGIEI